MPLDIQVGDLQQRLRNATRTTGRMPIQLDETVVPVIQLVDVAESPWRRNPRAFSISRSLPLAAGLQNMIGLETQANLVKVLRVTVSSPQTQAPFHIAWLPRNVPITGFAAVGVPQILLTERPISTGLGTALQPASIGFTGTGAITNAIQLLNVTMLSNRPFIHEPPNWVFQRADPVTGDGDKVFVIGAVTTQLNVTIEAEEYEGET